MSESHITTVINQYRRVQTWEARCSCGWIESSAFAVFADAAATRHSASRAAEQARDQRGTGEG